MKITNSTGHRSRSAIDCLKGGIIRTLFRPFRRAWGSLSILLGAVTALSPLYAADSELTNWKTGIDLHFGNSASTATDKGVAYAEEYLYFDKILDDHKVVYIKSGTKITMSHNSRNIAGSADGSDNYTSVAADVGVIKYKVDGDQLRTGLPPTWATYSAPVSFADLNYGFFGAPGIPVVGTTGATGGDLTEANRTSRYFRGIFDSVGDEWHILTVADDDSARTSNNEYKSSDGKIWYFVVNPKTPCATWRVSGSGQFYTTPPKKYFFPIIYDQTTYFTGTVTCELRDINGNNVFYRINGGNFINAGTNHVTLTQDKFNTGSNTLEYYYEGNAAYTKTRKVVKDPGYPSAKEAHGDRLWISAAQWTSEVQPRISADAELSKWRDFFRTSNTWNKYTDIASGARTGKRGVADTAFAHAFTARWEGMTYKTDGYPYTAADLARLSLFDTKALLDPIGYEQPSWSNIPIPCREMNYRGYYDVPGIYDAAASYDVLIGYYRADQGHANGITVIQDFFIRDTLARWVHNAHLIVSGYAPEGMWPTAHATGAAVIAGVMPSYSSEYFGTCGLDGNTTTYDWTPFPAGGKNHTWKDLFLSQSVPLDSYPGHVRQAAPSEHFSADGDWGDRIGYSDTNLFGKCVQFHYNMVKLFNPGTTYPILDLAMEKAAKGELYGLKFINESDKSPQFRAWIGLQNAWFPKFRDAARPVMLNKVWPEVECLGKQVQNGRPYSLIYYNHNLPLGSAAPPAPFVATPAFSPPSGTYTSAQNVTISTATSGATVRYTTNGSDPTNSTGTVYSSPVAISATTTLKAIAYNSTGNNSAINTGAYQISSVVQLPGISPAGGSYLSEQQITITCATPGVTIRYTMDGSAPTEQSTTYTGPFPIKSNMTIRAIGVKAGYQASGIKSESYQIGSVSSKDSIWGGGGLAEANETFSVSFMVTPATNSLVGLASAKTENFADLAGIVRFASGGFVDALNGDAYQASASLPYTPGNNYKVDMSVDMTTRRYSVTVTPSGSSPVVIATNYAFRSEQAAVASLGYLAIWSELGLATVNDLNIGTRPSPPTGLKVLGPDGVPVE